MSNTSQCLSVDCVNSIPGTENKMRYLITLIGNLTCPTAAVVGQVTASSSGSIPVGAYSWSLTVAGANATIGTQAVPTGTILSGVGPVGTAITLTTGATTTITYSYETTTAGNNNPT